MSKLCPSCKVELLNLQVTNTQNVIKQIWSHPPPDPFKPCPYQYDGLRVEVEVIDQFMCDKFQELVNSSSEKGFPQETPPPILKPEISRSNLSLIKERIAKGNLSVSEFDEVKKRLDLSE